ncbi:MAG: YbaY family lipoprotein [Gammaproteobacteria bacterium]|nr:YbaY family lipoprotein [Gammaproteobacteria bacterium]
MSRVLLPLLLMGLLWGCDQNPAPSTDSPTVMASLSGTLIYPQSPTLPADARIQVQLRDVSRADAPALVIAKVNLTVEGRQPPLPFTLNYDPALIQPAYSYSVGARISDGDGKLLLINDRHIGVLTRGGATAEVEVPLVAVIPAPTP